MGIPLQMSHPTTRFWMIQQRQLDSQLGASDSKNELGLKSTQVPIACLCAVFQLTFLLFPHCSEDLVGDAKVSRHSEGWHS